jgi:putative NADPH-quinone reductase
MTKTKNILLILWHPKSDSFCGALTDAYADGARESGHTVRILKLGEHDAATSWNLRINENTWENEEPIWAIWREDVKRAQHIIFVFPTWWYTVPAILKWWFDRLFVPKFSHQYTWYLKWKKLLEWRTASFYSTCGGPWYTYIATLWHPWLKWMRWTCWFVWIKRKYSHLFTKLAPWLRTPEELSAMLNKMKNFGRKAK